MKRMIVLLAILSLVFAVPALAGNDKTVNGDGNVGIQTNGAVKDNTIVGGNYNGGGNTTYNGNYNGGGNTNVDKFLSDNKIKDSFNTDNSKTGVFDNDVKIKDNLNDNQVGLVNQKGQDNQQGLINQKGHDNQTGLFNADDSFNDNSKKKNNSGIIGDKNHHNVIGGESNEYGEGGDAQQQGQMQGQAQGQLQGQGQAQKTDVNVDSHDVYEAKRNLPTGSGGAYTASAPEYNDQSTATGNVQNAATILQVRKTFTLRMLKALEAGEDMHVIVKAYQSMRDQLGYPEKGYDGMNPDAEITIILEIPTDMSSYMDIAHLTVIGEDDTTTMGAIAGAAVEAMRQGSDTLVVTGEGAKKVLEAGGWGVMLGGSGMMIAGDKGSNAAGAVIAPGIGYAKAKTFYGYCPWIQAFGLRAK
jgi:hypothetical protein